MYRVIKMFTDLQDKGYRYNVGDTYPREGAKSTKRRIDELSGSKNRQKVPLIEEVKEKKAEKVEKAEKPSKKED